MAIMKLSNVPELNEFAGTEKIYVNDNGETKQIACDKVVTGGGERIVLDINDINIDKEYIVSLAENGEDVWIKDGQHFSKIISYGWSVLCGSNSYFVLTYSVTEGYSSPVFKSCVVGMIGSELSDRLDNIPVT